MHAVVCNIPAAEQVLVKIAQTVNKLIHLTRDVKIVRQDMHALAVIRLNVGQEVILEQGHLAVQVVQVLCNMQLQEQAVVQHVQTVNKLIHLTRDVKVVRQDMHALAVIRLNVRLEPMREQGHLAVQAAPVLINILLRGQAVVQHVQTDRKLIAGIQGVKQIRVVREIISIHMTGKMDKKYALQEKMLGMTII